MELIFLLSVILNVVLGFAFFFRSAINDTVRDWWTGRRSRQKEQEDRLHELRGHLLPYPTYHFVMMMRYFIAERVQDDAEVQEHLRAVQEAGNKMQQIVDFIGANELRFSQEIQQGIRRLREEINMGDVIADPRRIFERHRLVKAACDRLKEQIEHELRQ